MKAKAFHLGNLYHKKCLSKLFRWRQMIPVGNLDLHKGKKNTDVVNVCVKIKYMFP